MKKNSLSHSQCGPKSGDYEQFIENRIERSCSQFESVGICPIVIHFYIRAKWNMNEKTYTHEHACIHTRVEMMANCIEPVEDNGITPE